MLQNCESKRKIFDLTEFILAYVHAYALVMYLYAWWSTQKRPKHVALLKRCNIFILDGNMRILLKFLCAVNVRMLDFVACVFVQCALPWPQVKKTEMGRTCGTFCSHIAYILRRSNAVGWDSSIGTANLYRLDGTGIHSRWGRHFPHSSTPTVGPHSLLYNRHWVPFPGVKRSGPGVNHPPPSSAEVIERVELYFYTTSGLSWPALGRALPLLF
jgi:hypothetical protein